MTKVLMAGDKLQERDTENDFCVDQERKSQSHKKLSHSIEEILRRPTCVKREKIVHRNWPVIKENSRTSDPHLFAGMFFGLLLYFYSFLIFSTKNNTNSNHFAQLSLCQ